MRLFFIILFLFGFLFFGTCGLIAQVPSQNLRLHLSFNDSLLVDNSIYAHSVINHSATFGAGVDNASLNLAGIDNYLEIRHANSLKISNNLTTSLWYKHQDQAGNGFYSLIEQSANENGGHSRYGTWIFNRNLLQTCIEPDACPGGGSLCQRCTTSSISLEEGKWYHIASVYDGSNLKIYIDGVLDIQRNFPSSTGISVRAYPLTIGTDIYDPVPVYLSGNLDEIKVFDIALSDSEIQDLFDDFIIASREEERLAASIKLYPSPASDFLYLEIPFNYRSLQVHNMQGQLMNKTSLTHMQILDLNFLNNGLYFLSIELEGFMVRKKFWVLKN